jgi:AcrR family transcriptional regulator
MGGGKPGGARNGAGSGRERPAPPASRALPRGPHRLGREVILASQRGRMLEAMAESVAERGYGSTTVADVVGRAGVSRKTFYEHFKDKEDCFLAAYDACVDILMTQVIDAREGIEDWGEAMRASLRAYLEVMAAEPALARTFLVEVLAAGPRALDRRAEVHARFADLSRNLHEQMRRDHPELPEPPESTFHAMVGAINELVFEVVREGRTAELPVLEDSILYLQTAVFAGHARAESLLARRPPA